VIFLPIVERELRVACRKRSTFWVRVAAAFVALVVGTGFLILTLVPFFQVGAATLGRGLFAVLTWLSLGATLLAGLFFTSDCLSEEKRAGTLGFLFLTDLRGHDVVLGKLLATSLRGAYAFLAIFPVLAISLLLGGVSGAQFWRSFLALLNALFVSLTAGLLVSAVSRDSQKALAATLLLLVLLALGGPAVDEWVATVEHRAFDPVLSLASPVYLFVTAGQWGQTAFWEGLGVNQAIGWSLLGLTCVLLPRAWQQQGANTSAVRLNRTYAWRFGGAAHRLALRRRLINSNPALWLACRERWQSLALWATTFWLAGAFVVSFGAPEHALLAFLWSPLAGLLTLALYLGISSQAARLFVEARRSGLLELMLATPLTGAQIVQGQWRALVRLFGAPVLLWLVMQFLGASLTQEMTWNRVPSTVPPKPLMRKTLTTKGGAVTTGLTVRVAPSPGAWPASPFFPRPGPGVSLFIAFVAALTTAANLAALAWFGMWMGLTSKTVNLATLKTFLWVEIVPSFVLSFVSMLVVPLFLLPAMIKGSPVAPALTTAWYPLAQSALVTLLFWGKDIGFVIWARRKLAADFRERAVQWIAPRPAALPPPLPRLSPPPVIP
jgi:ABC-2 family transporter protein